MGHGSQGLGTCRLLPGWGQELSISLSWTWPQGHPCMGGTRPRVMEGASAGWICRKHVQPLGKPILPMRSQRPKAVRASHCLEDLKQEGKCQQTPPREAICHQAGWSVTLRRKSGHLHTTLIGDVKVTADSNALPGHRLALSTQPSGSGFAAPSFAGHIDYAASSPTGHNVMEVVEIFPHCAMQSSSPRVQAQPSVSLPRWGIAHELFFIFL